MWLNVNCNILYSTFVKLYNKYFNKINGGNKVVNDVTDIPTFS